MSDTADPNDPITYAVRIMPRAERDIEAAIVRFADLEGKELAREWYFGLQSALASLALNPRRCPIAPEQAYFRREARHYAYRRTTSSVAYRLIFTISDADTMDAPVVALIHVRHGSARPLSRAEARTIEAQIP